MYPTTFENMYLCVEILQLCADEAIDSRKKKYQLNYHERGETECLTNNLENKYIAV